MTAPSPSTSPWQPLRDRWRVVTAFAALVAAAAHVPVIGEHLEEAPYMGVLFLLLTIACTVLAAAIVAFDARWTYGSATLICGLAIVGYAATRLVAFPQLADDVGNWLEPLGVVAVLSEATVVGLAARALHRGSPAAA
jgi:hypothetical protein